MGSGHGSTGDGVCTAVQPGGEDRDTRSDDVDNSAKVGERGKLVRTVGGGNGEGSGLRSGGDIGSVLSLVTSGNGHEDTGGDSVGDSGVDGSGLGSTERHAADDTSRAARAGLGIVGDVVDTGNDTRVCALFRG